MNPIRKEASTTYKTTIVLGAQIFGTKKKPKIFTFFIFGPDTSVTKLYLYISSQKLGKTQDPIKHENMKTILQSFHKLNFKITTKFF